jgi:hypothetical protein
MLLINVNLCEGNAAAKESFRRNAGAVPTITEAAKTYAFITNQIASATSTTMIAPQTMGVTFFELPLRGESFGAWL